MKLKEAWDFFVTKGKIDASIVRPVIAQSWKRCKAAGVDPYSSIVSPILGASELRELIRENQHFIDISWPIMKMTGEMIKGSGFMVDLFNREGYFLKIISDDVLKVKSRELGSVLGGNRSELVAGTNAIGLALSTGRPIQIVGPEHYKVNMQFWTCSAAPIRDSTGNITGVINISGNYTLLHKHTLGMAVAIADAIEKALRADEKIHELMTTNRFLNTLVDSINDGLIAIDNKGIITNVNTIGGMILGHKVTDLLGRNIKEVFHSDFSILAVVASKKEITDKNIFIIPFGSTEKHQYLVTVKCFDDHMGETHGAIAVLGEMKRVHRLVGGIIGAKATFNFESIIGKNERLRRAIEMAKVASTSTCKILIQGESGTGKEMFAQAIHNNSTRRDRPFIAINCAALPRDLVESELFGYEEGAFTGARPGGRPGKFELADGGTLLLDEIESMSLEAQPKLLRVLETNQVMRVGGSKYIPIDVRIISAAQTDLGQKVDEKTFREDLYYRLNMAAIHVPPLRERRDDIPILIDYFINKIGCRLGRKDVMIDAHCIDVLCNYRWQGNVRELENVIESAILLAMGGIITEKILPERVKRIDLPTVESIQNDISLEGIEKKLIKDVLFSTGGNMSRASKVLEIDRSTLYRKIKKYSIVVQ